ncbi:Taurine import ATP-binding protein TauB [Streptomyces sp. RB5]|uniref:Taurine import ATP-binding protein TauB n=1 Tax=Streptomyces smaragdinus TaxID=2585196 RepID=A0A7K0CM62_9ACTN|nr:ATP-binding cassette domain-containing protein [Streptomyces smaragdinus]MQY14511.1 Taurine import ATP-binding protein TauB [Streptomyces smaragdinus]
MITKNSNASGDCVIELKDAHVSFGDVVAVDKLSFQVNPGERVAILGQTGAGKSTIMNMLVGALAATSGTVRVVGLDPVADWHALRGKIAVAFQDARLLPWRTAHANVEMGLQFLGVDRRKRRDIAAEWLERVGLGHALTRYPHQLSGGMRQRVSLARALSVDPGVVLLDEAFSALDEATSVQLRGDFVRLAQTEKFTALIVTHSIEEAFEIADRVIVLGRPAKVMATYDTAEYDFSEPGSFETLRKTVSEMMRA